MKGKVRGTCSCSSRMIATGLISVLVASGFAGIRVARGDDDDDDREFRPLVPGNFLVTTDGLRNITGRVNKDGTATIWGITHGERQW